VLLGTTKTDSTGAFSFVVTIPRGTAAGTHTITVAGGGASASAPLVVTNGLAVTGIAWNVGILGLALLAAGVIVLAGDRIGKQDLIDFS
jgi:hypothetical protein